MANPLERLHSGADPGLIAYLKAMQESEPGLAGFGQAVLPRPMQELAGIAKPLSEFSRDFPEMQEYEQRARAIWNTPSIRVGDELLSPADFYVNELTAGAPLGAGADQFKEMGLRQLLSGEGLGPALADTLTVLKSQGVGGEEELFPGQTTEQREARRRDFGQESRYMTSENMDRNLLATRAYNMLTAMRDEPEFKPDFTSPMSAAFSALGTLNFGAYESEGDPGYDTRLLNSARWSAGQNPLKSRAVEALYWDKLADKQRSEGTYRDGMFGGFYPQFSRTTGEGFMRQDEDSANEVSYFDDFFLPHTIMGALGQVNTPTVGKNSELIRAMVANARREVPVVPSFPDDPAKQAIAEDDTQEMRKGISQYLQDEVMRGAQDEPIKQRKMAEKQGVPIKEFTYRTPFQDAVHKLPAYVADLFTLGSAGAGKVGALAELATESPSDLGVYYAQHSLNSGKGSGPLDFFTKPMEYVGVQDAEGKPADPNSPDYPQVLAKHRAEQEKLLGGLLNRASQYYGTTQGGSSNVRRGSSTQR